VSDERTFGYCDVCGEYGQGRFVRVISEYSDAIDEHVGCKVSRPRGQRPAHSHRPQDVQRRVPGRQT